MVNENVIEQRKCKQCETLFSITDWDREFYDKVAPIFSGKKYVIPNPTLCPDCRQQRRLSFRNERKLYHRQCDATGDQIISSYSPDPAVNSDGACKPYKIYSFDARWGDARNPMDYWRSFDPTRSFFEQFNELILAVPHIALRITQSQNSDYTSLSGYNKNCYLLFAAEYNEDCSFGTQLIRSKNSYDTLNCADVDHCYEATNCDKCYATFFARNCKECSNCMYVDDCIACSDCVFCHNLVNAQYCIFNKQYTKEEYALKKQETLNDLEQNKQKFATICQTAIKKNLVTVNNQNVIGDYLFQSKNLYNCFDLSYAEDCRYVSTWFEVKDVMDICHTTRWTLGYEATSFWYDAHHGIGVCGMWSGSSSIYVLDVHHSSNMFGCVGMRDKEYCILNKQYTREEYETLVPQIIEKMMADWERGEFFPSSISLFGYNETTAHEYFPLSREEALKKGFKRCDYEAPFPQVEKTLQANEVPIHIKEVSDDIVNHAIVCEVSGKPFRITKPELAFYRQHNLSIPKRHPDQRHLDRMALRNPRKLRERTCNKCWINIKTSYAPERTEIVYCEACYNREIYW